jgi:hypothetical protein
VKANNVPRLRHGGLRSYSCFNGGDLKWQRAGRFGPLSGAGQRNGKNLRPDEKILISRPFTPRKSIESGIARESTTRAFCDGLRFRRGRRPTSLGYPIDDFEMADAVFSIV